ncbi:BlaI/MecI/CopY family transcriptional regulator [Enterococcus casseliflavus]|uniref:BlaI/MecI/CopY family transcriptional regulator n=1 Tax=Enterococcus casseliflavus TaxID=37734 RepID=UPI00232BC815|nr:BlaI/MecI/CopY family transcriptional regulator [Enterococcus casseliflavus]MDB1688211.1 BlaI/MecI/CopY family transcriptional regulator [Enterococcus casseliflavus]
MSGRRIQVSNSELEVLKFIWRFEPVTCGLITHEMQEFNQWHPSTSKTLIKRLLDKKVIAYKITNSQRLYYSLMKRQEFLEIELQRLLSGMDDKCISDLSCYLNGLVRTN